MSKQTIELVRREYWDGRKKGTPSQHGMTVTRLYLLSGGLLLLAFGIGLYGASRKRAGPPHRRQSVVASTPRTKPASKAAPIVLSPELDPFRYIRPQVLRATVKIRCGDQTGSGVIVGEREGHWIVLTASHLVDEDSRIWVSAWPSFVGIHSGTTIEYQRDADLCLIKVSPLRDSMPGSIRIAKHQDEPASQLMLFTGCENGRHPSSYLAELVGFTSVKYRDGIFYKTSNDRSRPGTSGGPLVNAAGELVGIHRGHGVFASLMELQCLADDAAMPELYQ